MLPSDGVLGSLHPAESGFVPGKWAWMESNHRHTRYERGALTTELQAQVAGSLSASPDPTPLAAWLSQVGEQAIMR